MSAPLLPSVPVAVGELADKITILRLKQGKMEAGDARARVEDELQLLEKAWEALPVTPEVAGLVAELAAINAELWEVEDQLRALEAEQRFDEGFITLARSVYITNDRRAAAKRAINRAMNSRLVEEKVHPSYGERNAP